MGAAPEWPRSDTERLLWLMRWLRPAAVAQTLARWPQVVAAAMLLGLFTRMIRAAVHERGAPGVGGTIGLWVLMGVPAAQNAYQRAHGDLPPRSDRWR